jgi:hypothetical protein
MVEERKYYDLFDNSIGKMLGYAKNIFKEPRYYGFVLKTVQNQKNLKKYRNLIPILSIEGDENITDDRRGEGIYKLIQNKMDSLKSKLLKEIRDHHNELETKGSCTLNENKEWIQELMKK